jgi:hypothetical protein
MEYHGGWHENPCFELAPSSYFNIPCQYTLSVMARFGSPHNYFIIDSNFPLDHVNSIDQELFAMYIFLIQSS